MVKLRGVRTARLLQNLVLLLTVHLKLLSPSRLEAYFFIYINLFIASFTLLQQDTSPQLVENGLRMLLQLITSWKNGEPAAAAPGKLEPLASVVRGAEALGLVMLCQCKAYPRRLAVHILK